MNTKLVGALGEQTAARYLRREGYTIKAANFKTNVGEIDIIAEKGNALCFVEVKTRTVGGMLPPREAVDINKQENIKSTAAAYISKYKLAKLVQYDIFEVMIDSNLKVVETNYIPNAFK